MLCSCSHNFRLPFKVQHQGSSKVFAQKKAGIERMAGIYIFCIFIQKDRCYLYRITDRKKLSVSSSNNWKTIGCLLMAPFSFPACNRLDSRFSPALWNNSYRKWILISIILLNTAITLKLPTVRSGARLRCENGKRRGWKFQKFANILVFLWINDGPICRTIFQLLTNFSLLFSSLAPTSLHFGFIWMNISIWSKWNYSQSLRNCELLATTAMRRETDFS